MCDATVIFQYFFFLLPDTCCDFFTILNCFAQDRYQSGHTLAVWQMESPVVTITQDSGFFFQFEKPLYCRKCSNAEKIFSENHPEQKKSKDNLQKKLRHTYDNDLWSANQ